MLKNSSLLYLIPKSFTLVSSTNLRIFTLKAWSGNLESI